MATAAQTSANRLNAQKSTGPRTPEGKTVVSQNAVKHGLLARAAVLQGEDWEEFTEFRENLLEELYPDGTLEVLLAERIVSLSWRLQRAARLQNEAYESMYLQEATSGYGKMRRAEMAHGHPAGTEVEADDLIGGRMLAEDFGGAKVLDRMLLYERRIEHSLYRTMAELQKQRLKQEAEPLAAGATRSTGILPVRGFPNATDRVWGPSSMGVVSPTRKDAFGVPVPPTTVEDTHGQDARDTHGRDAHATQPLEGGTLNGVDTGEPSCETNPICVGSNDVQVPCGTEVRNDLPQSEVGETNPICDKISLRNEDAPEHIVSGIPLGCPGCGTAALGGVRFSAGGG